ncbi:DUF4865 family protein [Streptomyces sp. NBC_01591]|uniref:DUF4865 family protein n=1 Tax=Streptomyces sp. NBC_01591 TaxID=2975888 RepID=UPI002DDC5A9A|nr:DUF4865 family protein [Streptomyces sp. NBC_01591]WSD66845.1 DUF4865 family protein [Streptomyces sp. NBC_01591]
MCWPAPPVRRTPSTRASAGCSRCSPPPTPNSFLWGPGFQGVVQDFGRPEVQHWTGLAYREGPASAALPRTATRHRTAVATSVPPADAVEAALTALAVDPRRWELLHFTLWEHDAPEAPEDRYQVLHLSTPERDRLGEGRQW